jgi:hypothetical protein
MPKPAMTLEDVKAINDALKQSKAAEDAMQQAFIEQKPTTVVNKAIREWMNKRQIWNSMGEKFFERWPKN